MFSVFQFLFTVYTYRICLYFSCFFFGILIFVFFIDFALSWPLMKLSIKLAIKRTRCGDSNDKLSDWVGWGRAAMG